MGLVQRPPQFCLGHICPHHENDCLIECYYLHGLRRGLETEKAQDTVWAKGALVEPCKEPTFRVLSPSQEHQLLLHVLSNESPSPTKRERMQACACPSLGSPIPHHKSKPTNHAKERNWSEMRFPKSHLSAYFLHNILKIFLPDAADSAGLGSLLDFFQPVLLHRY